MEVKDEEVQIVSETVLFKRFLKLWDRTVKFSNGKEVKWDVVGHQFERPAFATVFPFDTKNQTVTLLREYCQGTNDFRYTLVAGSFDRTKHENIKVCAQHELSEEARLKNGTLIPLLNDENHIGIGEIKWGTNTFLPFLVLDAELDTNPLPRDEEEFIEIHYGISLPRLREIILQGEMTLPSVQTTLMALNYLEKNSYLSTPVKLL